MDNKLSIPEHIIAAAHKVVTVETHVMKKLAGVQDVASIGAIAELAMPQVSAERLHHYHAWTC